MLDFKAPALVQKIEGHRCYLLSVVGNANGQTTNDHVCITDCFHLTVQWFCVFGVVVRVLCVLCRGRKSEERNEQKLLGAQLVFRELNWILFIEWGAWCTSVWANITGKLFSFSILLTLLQGFIIYCFFHNDIRQTPWPFLNCPHLVYAVSVNCCIETRIQIV